MSPETGPLAIRCVLMFSLLHYGTPLEIYDVTTIYKTLPSDLTEDSEGKDHGLPVEVHMRTNALGMAPLTPGGYIEPENSEKDLLCVDNLVSGPSCDWVNNGFEWLPSQGNYATYISNSSSVFLKEVEVEGCQDLRDDYYYDDIFKQYRYRSYYGHNDLSCKIFVYPISTVSFFKFEIISRCGDCIKTISLNYCTSVNFWRKLEIDDVSTCTELSINQYNYYGRVNTYLRIKLQAPSTMQVWVGTSSTNEIQQILDEDLSQRGIIFSDTVRQIQTSNQNPLSILKLYGSSHKALQTESENSTLVSPKVTLEYPSFCLLVMFSLDSQHHTISLQDVLSVFAVDNFNELNHLGTYRTQQYGSHTWKIEKDISKDIQGKPIKIILKTLTDHKVEVLRISSCSSEEKEHVTLITPNNIKAMNLSESDRIPYTIFDLLTTANTNYKVDANYTCDNGGVWTSAGCACPAGFTGPSCARGCGPNRYGHDCTGLCSMYGSLCQGMWLCTAETGCHCAPGYHGTSCDLLCNAGSYGVDCLQTCGHCKSDLPCDKFTGLCSNCKMGFYPPTCKEKYIHFTTAPTVSSKKYASVSVEMDFSLDYLSGTGVPKFAQFQYKAIDYDSEWKVYATLDIPKRNNDISIPQLSNRSHHLLTQEMDRLRDAVKYLIRVVLITEDYSSYEGDSVPTAVIITKCEIPDSYGYNISMSYGSYSQGKEVKFMTISWTPYKTRVHWCPLESYEIWWKEGWQWKSKMLSKSQTSFTLHNVFPESQTKLKLRANTIDGPAPFSTVLKATSPYEGTHAVTGLKADKIQHNKADISWSPPEFTDSQNINNYSVSYECTKQPTCSLPCNSAGTLTSQETRAVLGPLLPAAQYEVSVSADNGPSTFIYFGTSLTVPVEIPKESTERPLRTNSTATVFWEPVPVCTGFFESYHYDLYMTSDSTRSVESGNTKNTTVTFTNLKASTDYMVKVSVVSTGGWDPSNHLTINISTAATVPDQVRSLTVYKRSRSMLGLRWAEPNMLYGALQSFTVTYSYGQGSEQRSVTVQPTRCSVWPDLYCHTLEGLKPARTYNVTVKARNKEIHEDGYGISILGQTKESSPGSPENLMVMNMTSTSLGLQWEHPNLTNGVLRSFLISIEETEQFNQDECCQVYPIVEISVNQEKKYYEVEVSDLHPASTYTISVAGKTAGFGPSQTITASTRPPALPLTAPSIFINSGEQVTWLPQQSDSSSLKSSAEFYTPLIQSHIILVVSNTSIEDRGIDDQRLLNILDERISSPYYFAAEYSGFEEVILGDLTTKQSQWGRISNPEFVSGDYQLAAVQISEYNKVLNVDVIFTSKFTVS